MTVVPTRQHAHQPVLPLAMPAANAQVSPRAQAEQPGPRTLWITPEISTAAGDVGRCGNSRASSRIDSVQCRLPPPAVAVFCTRVVLRVYKQGVPRSESGMLFTRLAPPPSPPFPAPDLHNSRLRGRTEDNRTNDHCPVIRSGQRGCSALACSRERLGSDSACPPWVSKTTACNHLA